LLIISIYRTIDDLRELITTRLVIKATNFILFKLFPKGAWSGARDPLLNFGTPSCVWNW